MMRGRWLTVLGFAAAVMACRSNETTTDDPTPQGGNGGTGGEGGTRPDPLPLTVLNWNVHNLIDDDDDGAMFETFDPNWQEHVMEVADVLRDLDPDIAVLQEVEHLELLTTLSNVIDNGYEHIVLIDANDPRGIDVGVLSKVPLGEVVSHQNDQFQANGSGQKYYFSRDAIEVHLTFNTRDIVLLGVHFKAKDDDDPQKRLAEAQRTRAIADALIEADPERGVIMLGDFNDTPASPPYDATLGTSPEFVNAPDSVATDDRWTYNYQGNLELVDHQMASPLLGEMLDEGSVRIDHSSAADAASDHAPIIATYDVN
jgi:endonuclease/exonuclease/phosphatase family metal-dependent hydrolase